MKVERRFVSTSVRPVNIERRDNGRPVLAGYAAVFYRENDPGTEYQLMPGLRERIARSAFDSALANSDDARGLYNHNPDWLLGRRSAGTLRLSVDDNGLRYEIDPPDTQMGRDVVTSIERGDLTGSSFAFFIRRASWIEGDEGDVRQVEDVELVDVGPVTYPAYEASTTGLRSEGSLDEVLKEWEARKAERRKRDIAEAQQFNETMLRRAKLAGL